MRGSREELSATDPQFISGRGVKTVPREVPAQFNLCAGNFVPCLLNRSPHPPVARGSCASSAKTENHSSPKRIEENEEPQFKWLPLFPSGNRIIITISGSHSLRRVVVLCHPATIQGRNGNHYYNMCGISGRHTGDVYLYSFRGKQNFTTGTPDDKDSSSPALKLIEKLYCGAF